MKGSRCFRGGERGYSNEERERFITEGLGFPSEGNERRACPGVGQLWPTGHGHSAFCPCAAPELRAASASL